jgi:hypothetical protein
LDSSSRVLHLKFLLLFYQKLFMFLWKIIFLHTKAKIKFKILARLLLLFSFSSLGKAENALLFLEMSLL